MYHVWVSGHVLAAGNNTSVMNVMLAILSTPFPCQQALDENLDLLEGITGFEDSVRKCMSL